MWRQICIVLLFLIFGTISTTEAVRGESPEKVRAALDVAQDRLGDGENWLATGGEGQDRLSFWHTQSWSHVP